MPVYPELLAQLERHLESVSPELDALVFTSPRGETLRYGAFVNRCWYPALQRVEVPRVSVHVLRHSAAAALIRSGASAKAVQSILGHQSAAFTLTTYGHIFEADLDELAERLQDILQKAQTGPIRDQSGHDGLRVAPSA